MKRLLTDAKITILAVLGFLVIRAIYSTLRLRIVGLPHSEKYLASRESPAIILFWHGHQLLMPRTMPFLFGPHTYRKTYVLISEHGDGRLIARLIRLFKLYSVAGSSTRGARKATIRLLKLIKDGHNISITPDGPKGPRHVVKEGVARIAQLSGIPVIPVGVAVSRYWQMKSWDKMILPKPFSKIDAYFGEPYYVPADDKDVQVHLDTLRDLLQHHTNFVEQTTRA